MLENLKHDYAPKVIMRLLKMPTYKSILETQFDSLLKLATFRSKNYDSIVQQIFAIHLRQPVESAAYLNNTFEVLIKKLESLTRKNSKNYKEYFSVALLLISESMGSKLSEQRELLISTSVRKVLPILSQSSKLSADNVCSLLEFLSKINFMGEAILSSENNVRKLLKK